MKHVFISYVHEDMPVVEQIKSTLEKVGVKVWLDRTSLGIGQRWKHGIKKAIEEGSFFIACFSNNSTQKNSTYMNEELTIAIEQLRLKPYETSWFIPVRLSDCKIPDRPIGAGEYLSDLQRIDLFEDYIGGIQKIAELIIPIVSPHEHLTRLFKRVLDYHINHKIEHFQNLGAQRIKQIEDKWIALLDEKRYKTMFDAFFELYERAKVTGKPELDKIVEPAKEGNVILLSVIPHQNTKEFLESLPVSISESQNRYCNFIIEERRKMRQIQNWDKRDFIHIIYFEDKGDVLFDILYMENIQLKLTILGFMMEKGGLPKKPGEKFTIGWENMYPTCLLTSIEASEMEYQLIREEAALIK